MEWIRLSVASIFIIVGVLFMAFATFGIYRFKYVLNRMHSAAMGDTLGIFSCLFGLMIITGFTFTSLKLLLVIICLWITSPVASHLISRLEVTTNEKLKDNCEIKKIEDE